MSTPAIRVVIADVGKDAVLYHAPGQGKIIYVRPGQTFDSAVKAVQAALGNETDVLARHLVEKHLPDLIRLDALLEVPEPPSDRPWRRATGVFWVVGLVVLVLLLAWAMLCLDMHFEAKSQERGRAGSSTALVERVDQNGGSSLAAAGVAQGSPPPAG